MTNPVAVRLRVEARPSVVRPEYEAGSDVVWFADFFDKITGVGVAPTDATFVVSLPDGSLLDPQPTPTVVSTSVRSILISGASMRGSWLVTATCSNAGAQVDRRVFEIVDSTPEAVEDATAPAVRSVNGKGGPDVVLGINDLDGVAEAVDEAAGEAGAIAGSIAGAEAAEPFATAASIAASSTEAAIAAGVVARGETLSALTTAMSASSAGAVGEVWGANSDEGIYRKQADGSLLRAADTNRQIAAAVAAVPVETAEAVADEVFELTGLVAGSDLLRAFVSWRAGGTIFETAGQRFSYQAAAVRWGNLARPGSYIELSDTGAGLTLAEGDYQLPGGAGMGAGNSGNASALFQIEGDSGKFATVVADTVNGALMVEGFPSLGRPGVWPNDGLLLPTGGEYSLVEDDTANGILQIEGGGGYTISLRVDPDNGLVQAKGFPSLGISPVSPATAAEIADDRIATRVFGPLDVARTCFIGDSNTDFAQDKGSGTLIAHNMRGYPTWLGFLSRRAIDYQQADNYGISGDRSDEAILKAGEAAAGAYDIAFVMIGTNDLTADFTADVTVANTVTIVETMLAAGTRVVLLPILPRRTTLYRAAVQSQITRRMAAYARETLGVRWVDPRDRITDPATGLMISSAGYDNLHTTPVGAYIWAAAIWDAVQDWFRPQPAYLSAAPWEAWDGTDNPHGNLLANPMATGTGGTVSSPVTGVAPDSWTAEVSGTVTGGTIAWSREARTDGVQGDWLRLDVTSLVCSGTIEVRLRQDVPISSGKYAAADVIEAGAEVEVLPSSVLAIQCGVTMVEDNGASYIEYTDLNAYLTHPLPSTGYSGVCATPQATIRATSGGAPSLSVRLVAKVRNGATLSARFGRPFLRRVI